MGIFRHLSASLALLFTAAGVLAQAHEGDWVSYRDAYRAMVVFEKYGKPKNFLQNHFQVIPRDKYVAPDGLQLTLEGKTTRVNLALDLTGRTVLPMSKQAYDENAALVLNRKVNQYRFRPRVSIVVRPDGVYETGDLRAACEQALAYQRHVELLSAAGQCAGVRFVFGHGANDPGVRLRKGEVASLATNDGPAFAGDPYEGFRVVEVRFDGLDKSQVATPNAPLVITPLVE